MFRNQYNKMGLQCIVVLLALMINGCSFYKVSVENNNVKQEDKPIGEKRYKKTYLFIFW